MPYKNLVLLLSLAVVLGSCKKDELEPTMVGRWPIYSVIEYEYDASGSQISRTERIAPAGGHYMVITDSTIENYHADGTRYVTSHYTRTGNVLTYRNSGHGFISIITKLTATELSIYFRKNQSDLYAGERRYIRP